MSPSPNFRASIFEIVSDALSASEEQLVAMRSEALLELDLLRREATEEARQRVRQGEVVARAMLQAAQRESDELRDSVAGAVEDARREIGLLEEQLEALGAARGRLSTSRERLAEVDSRLRHIPPREQAAGAPPAEGPPGDLVAAVEREPEAPAPPARGAEAGAHDGEPSEPREAPPAPGFKTQRRLAFSAAETRLAAAALTNAAVDKLDLVEELVASPNFSAEERSLSLMVLLREAEQLSHMAAQFGRPPLDLTERLLELRRRTTRLLHGDEPED